MATAGPRVLGATMVVVGLPELEKRLSSLASFSTKRYVANIGTDLTDPPYPYFLEYGTSRMQAYPTARPAFDERYPEAVATAARVLEPLVTRGSTGADYEKAVVVALEAGALPIANGWKQHVQRGPVPSHTRRGKTVSNLSDTGTYARSITVKVTEGEI